MFMSDEDREIIESMEYDKSLKPRFEWLKSCLFWKDEWPSGLSRDGQATLALMLTARHYIYHIGLPEEEWAISAFGNMSKSIQNVWSEAVESGLKWPGFEKDRLYLSDEYKALLAEELRILSELDEL